jgi:uncharacterized protein
MEFAVNYSPVLAGLVREGRVRVDRFKCPTWPELVAEAQQTLPVYIHFPLGVGGGWGGPRDSETHDLADLDQIDRLLEQTGTPLINTHFVPPAARYPHIHQDSRDPRHIQEVVDSTLRDLEPLLDRFGPERVTLENVVNEHGWLTLAVLPEVIAAILESTGCGFLFDQSHARLAARNLGLDERAYAASLPLAHTREVHVTGLQLLTGPLLDLMVAIGDPYGFAKTMAGRWIDHLPMLEGDWPELEWILDQVRAGRAGQPWVVAYEYGGVGRFWEDVTKAEVYLEQLPRMKAMIQTA